jgi:hypothetical protein
LEQLALAHHDHRLGLDAAGKVVEARSRLAGPDDPEQKHGAAREQRARNQDREGERSRIDQ